jgi:hypothetical protein
MIYFLYFGSTLPNSKMSIAQAAGHKAMTSAEFKVTNRNSSMSACQVDCVL